MKRLLLLLIRAYRTHISPGETAPLPLYPHLLGLCPGGGGEIRRVQGRHWR